MANRTPHDKAFSFLKRLKQSTSLDDLYRVIGNADYDLNACIKERQYLALLWNMDSPARELTTVLVRALSDDNFGNEPRKALRLVLGLLAGSMQNAPLSPHYFVHTADVERVVQNVINASRFVGVALAPIFPALAADIQPNVQQLEQLQKTLPVKDGCLAAFMETVCTSLPSSRYREASPYELLKTGLIRLAGKDLYATAKMLDADVRSLLPCAKKEPQESTVAVVLPVDLASLA